MSKYKTVFFTLGILQIILGLSMIVPILTQFFYNQLDSGFISSGLVTIVFGILFFLANLDHDKKLNLPKGSGTTVKGLCKLAFKISWFGTFSGTFLKPSMSSEKVIISLGRSVK